MQYIEPDTGRTYAIDEPRWRGEGGRHLNLTPGPGLTRSQIRRDRYSVWRYAAAIEVDEAEAVTLGEGWTPMVPGEWQGTQTLSSSNS